MTIARRCAVSVRSLHDALVEGQPARVYLPLDIITIEYSLLSIDKP